MTLPVVHVVGLGPAGADLVTAGTLELIERVSPRYLRTTRHPAASVLPAGTASFDDRYETAATDQHADRQIQMPGLRGQRRQQQAARHQDHAQFHDGSRTEAIHHPSHQGTHYARDQKSERECAGGDATLPMEFVDDGRK